MKVKHVHNPVARVLRSRALRPHTVRTRKGKGSYRRKERHHEKA